ncbi:MAG: helix-turn-helix domain-containing protein, partial [bacterium]
MEINKKINEIRVIRGFTLEQLAELTQLTKGYLSKIERSSKAPPFSTLETIAQALNFDINVFFKKPEEKKESKNIDIVKNSKNRPFIKSSAGYSFKTLVGNYRNKYMSPFLIKVPSGETKMLKHDAEEFIYV